jgi:hypothetical protein
VANLSRLRPDRVGPALDQALCQHALGAKESLLQSCGYWESVGAFIAQNAKCDANAVRGRARLEWLVIAWMASELQACQRLHSFPGQQLWMVAKKIF